MNKHILFIFLISILSCETQINDKILSEEFQWEITLPTHFKKIEVEKWEKIKKEGETHITNNTDTELNNLSNLIFVVENGEFNRFDANYTSKLNFIEPNTTFKESFDKINSITYDSFVNIAPNAKIDTTTTTEMIDGLKFLKFEMNTEMDESFIIKSRSYKRLFDDKVLSININFVDDRIGSQILNSLKTSKFNKN
ncbi:hypothetical protein VDP25_17050 [Winogradskyella sp. ECml5-4]|uniref:hypothetical protein n=1 Tax=Winogradskyella sp. ECml5-4 TaxID=3110975 RepID=UPI002FF248C8